MDALDYEIKNFFDSIENQNENDKHKTLRNLLDKHIHLSKSDHQLDYRDLNFIISGAKSKMTRIKMPAYFKGSLRPIQQFEASSLALVESTISYLNSIDCLKKTPKFDLE